MTEHEKHLLEIGAVAVGALAVILFLKHQPSVSTTGGAVPVADLGINDQSENPATDYLTYNYPPSLVQQPLPGVPAQSTTTTTTPCGCGCGNGACNSGSSGLDLAPNLDALAADYSAKLEGFQDNYAAQIEAATPSYFSQYFNNVNGATASNDVTGQFLALQR